VHVRGFNRGTFFDFINIANAFVYFQVAGRNQLSFVGTQCIHPYSTGQASMDMNMKGKFYIHGQCWGRVNSNEFNSRVN